jgi:AAA15 family ATPase/GTPase
MYLKRFTLPIEKEADLLCARAEHNGGPKYGYIDNPYPCGLFSDIGFGEAHFDRITIFYGGNGSGKSTLLNLNAEKLKLNRIAPYNSS